MGARGLSVAVVLALCWRAGAQAPAKPAAPAAEGAVAATVNGQPIYEALIQRYLEHVPPSKRAERRIRQLNVAIDELLVEQYVTQLQVPIEDGLVEKKIEEGKAESKKAGKDFGKILQEMGITESQLRDHVLAELRWEKFAGERATDAVLKQQFEESRELFDGTVVQARHILLTPPFGDVQAVESARQKLLAIKQEIEAGVTAGLAKLPPGSDSMARETERARLTEDAFAKAARENSVCPSKVEGGNVGWFQGTGIMVDPFARAAFSLKPYTVSDAVQTEFGLHLILVTNRKNGQQVTFEQARNAVREYYFHRLHDAVVAQMRPRSRIDIVPIPVLVGK